MDFQKIQLARVLPLVFVALVVPGGLPSIVVAMLEHFYLFAKFLKIYRIIYPLVLTRHFWSPVVTRVFHTTEAGKNVRYLYPRIIQHLEQSNNKVYFFQDLVFEICITNLARSIQNVTNSNGTTR